MKLGIITASLLLAFFLTNIETCQGRKRPYRIKRRRPDMLIPMPNVEIKNLCRITNSLTHTEA
jgi:hypothetical protein